MMLYCLPSIGIFALASYGHEGYCMPPYIDTKTFVKGKLDL